MIVGSAAGQGGERIKRLSQNLAYKIRIKTDSADHNALMLFYDGELAAILVELTDECHGVACGQWTIEAIYGLHLGRPPPAFGSAEEAAGWISLRSGQPDFCLSPSIADLP